MRSVDRSTGGGSATTYDSALRTVAVPFVIVIAPSTRLGGTVAVSSLFETALKSLAVRLPNLTPVVPVKPAPLIVTDVPVGPFEGVKPVMPKVTVNVGPSAGLSDPAGTTWTGEVRSAPSGTSAVRDVADATLTVGDGRPAKSTSGAPWNPVPVSVTVVVPLVPDVGLSFVIVGSTTRSGGLAFVPRGVATVSGPVVAVAGIEPIVIFVVPVTLNGRATAPTLTEVTPTNVVPVMSNGAEPVCA